MLTVANFTNCLKIEAGDTNLQVVSKAAEHKQCYSVPTLVYDTLTRTAPM